MLTMRRTLAIVLSVFVALHAIAGGAGGMAIFCLGGGHEHSAAEVDHCQSTCGHDAAWPLPVPASDQDHDCGCTDVTLLAHELLALPWSQSVLVPAPEHFTTFDGNSAVRQSMLGYPGQPTPPPELCSGIEQRLAIIASTRLTI